VKFGGYATLNAPYDLRSVGYIANHDPLAAERVAQRIVETVERLATFPASGRPGRKPDTRELVISNTFSYLVVYGVRSGIVYILRVLHTAQRPR
jgi:toxin ParE1/3/4